MSLIAEKYSGRKAIRVNGSPTYQFLGGSLIPIADNGQSYVNQYGANDTIYSIINLILDKVRVAPWAVYKVKDQSSLKQLQAILKRKDISPEDFRRAKNLLKKSLEPVKDPGKIGELLKYPNEYESFPDFVANGCGYKLLTGNKFIWADILQGGANKGLPNKLWLMPSQYTRVVAKTGFPCKVVGYELPVLGLEKGTGFSVEEVLHEKYMNYDFSVNGAHLLGMAPLKAALRRLNKNNSGLDTAASKFQNGGMEGIIYVDEPNISDSSRKGANAQAAAVKQSLISEYSGPLNAGKFATSGWKIGVAQLGYSPVELALLESDKVDLRFFANTFGIPSQLLNDPENKSYNNQKEGEKALTSRCALPLLTSFRDSINRMFTTYWGMDKNWLIDFDMTVYTELQQDVSEMMNWLEKLMANGYPLNRALEMLNIEKLPQPEFDEPWITPGMGQPLSEWQMNEVDNALNNDGQRDQEDDI